MTIHVDSRSIKSVRSALVAIAALVIFTSSAFADQDKAPARRDCLVGSAPEAPVVLYNDPVTEGFQRMLTHEPNWVAPAAPANAETDPLIEALALPVLQWSAEGRNQIRAAR